MKFSIQSINQSIDLERNRQNIQMMMFDDVETKSKIPSWPSVHGRNEQTNKHKYQQQQQHWKKIFQRNIWGNFVGLFIFSNNNNNNKKSIPLFFGY